jgi:seryl-tRNA synthetase
MTTTLTQLQDNIDHLFLKIFDSIRSHDGSVPQEESMALVIEQYRLTLSSVDTLVGSTRSVKEQESEIQELLDKRSQLIESIKSLESDLQAIDSKCDKELYDVLNLSCSDVKKLGR